MLSLLDHPSSKAQLSLGQMNLMNQFMHL